jgi:CarboxypepD_reg-like domain/TonB-dependent Receptor Plug Domain/Secretin and TonB N terminus short domain
MKTIVTVWIMLLALPFFAQNTNQKITLSMKNKSVAECLEYLKSQYGCNIAYDANLSDMDKTISIKVKDSSIPKALQELLTNTNLTFKLVGGQYVIFLRKDGMGQGDTNEEINHLSPSSKDIQLSGYIYDNENGESLINAVVEILGTNTGVVTNNYGYYSINLPAGKATINISYLGYITLEKSITLNENTTMNFRMESANNVIKEVLVLASNTKSKEHVKNTEMSKINIPMEVLKKVPVLFGESDIMKAIQLLPGIKRGREGGLGLYIRGGSSDENLILLDEAAVYNPGHLLGFLSVFNSNSLKSTDIYKGAFPANYGGRLSGVLDARMKEGNDRNFGAEGSIGNISSSLTVEAPIIKDKCSFILSGRRSYLDKIISFFPYYFYDLNAKINYKIKDRDRIFVSSYLGRDILEFGAESDTFDLDLGFGFSQGNTTSTVRWNHIYKGNKMFHNFTIISSNFKYNVGGYSFDNRIDIKSSITDLGLKMDYDYALSDNTQLKFGGQLLFHTFKPNLFVTKGDTTGLEEQPKIVINNYESGLYASLDRAISNSVKINLGMRFTSSFSENTNYINAEPRASMRLALHERHSIKAGFSRMNQYLHLIAGSTIALPTDLWYPATKNVKPGKSDQVNLGYYTYMGKNDGIQLSLESYYKWMYNLVEYKEGARIILNNEYENELVFGKGTAYGFEVMVQKNKGIVSGWVGYTLSWAKRQFDEINNGKPYYSKYDRRHDVSAVISLYSPSHKSLGLSFAWVYSSGSPFTPVVAKYIQPLPNNSGIDLLPIYSTRNAHRLNGSSRLDIDFVIYGKKKKHFQGEWHIGAYNALNKVQPSRVVIKFDESTGKEKYQEKGIFGFIFSIAYKFKFQ